MLCSLKRPSPVALVLVVSHLAACTKWVPTSLSPPELLEQDEPPRRIRIIDMAGDTLQLSRLAIRNDSIRGMAEDGRLMGRPLEDVAAVELPDYAAARSIVIVTGLALVIYGISRIDLSVFGDLWRQGFADFELGGGRLA